MATPQEFQAAVDLVQTFTKRPDNQELLSLYGLFKQATEGDNTGTRPGGFDFKAIAKFDAWAAQKGKATMDAQSDYIALVNELKQRYA